MSNKFRFAQLLFFIFAVIAVVITILAIDNQSYVLLSFGAMQAKATLWSLVVAIAILYPLLRWILSGAMLLISGRWLSQHREERQQKRFLQGLLSYLEGDWYETLAQLKPLNKSGDNMISLIIGAKAAEHLNKTNIADNWIAQAISISEPHQLAPQFALVESLISRQESKKALHLLNDLDDSSAKRYEVIRLKMDILKQLELWPDLLQLIETHHTQLQKILGKATLVSLIQQAQNAASEQTQQPATPTV